MTTPNTHQAMVWAVLELHKLTTIRALTGDCAAEECDHDDTSECETFEFVYCMACNELAESVNPYYMENEMRVTQWPCITVQLIDRHYSSI